EKFDYKLYGPIPLRFHRGQPTKYEFDLNLGIVHFTEQDFEGLSAIVRRVNAKWGTLMTFCIYPSKDKARDMILNFRGSPMAPPSGTSFAIPKTARMDHREAGPD